MSDNTRQTDPDAVLQTPGQSLKAGREKLGLSQKEVASQLNLQTDMIDAVEKDDKDRLPASTYVRGYIRNYAKIVNLDANELIKLYENDAAAPPEIVPEIKSHMQVSSTDKPIKAVTYLITFGLVLLLIAWLQSQYVVKESAGEQTDATGSAEEYQELPSYSSTATQQTPATKEYVEEPVIGPGLSLTIQEPLPQISESIVGTIELPSTTTAAIPGTVPDNGHDSENIETLLPAGDEIKFKITRESWIEVYDSGNQRLFMGLAKPGDALTLSGIAPFDILLGYSPGVEVRFNGELFNTEPHSRSGIARFKLGDKNDLENQE